MKKCDECKGDGYIPLLVSKKKCTKCNGSGKIEDKSSGNFPIIETQEGSLFFVDASNNRVSIGSGSPDGPVYIDNNNRFTFTTCNKNSFVGYVSSPEKVNKDEPKLVNSCGIKFLSIDIV